jgi:hypothetical protein
LGESHLYPCANFKLNRAAAGAGGSERYASKIVRAIDWLGDSGQAPLIEDLITLVSQGDLARTYQMAFDVAGLKCKVINAEKMALTDLFHLAKEIESTVKRPLRETEKRTL